MDILSLGVNFVKLINKVRYGRRYNIDRSSPVYSSLPVSLIRSYNNARILGPQKYICHAPFVNMYFGVDGNVTACCYNRNFPFGNIKHATISEMWHGESASSLRTYLEHNDFSHGCEKCEWGIRSGSYNMVEAGSYDRLEPGKDTAYPKRMVFELSGTCNLACKMCNGMLSSTYRKHYENEAPHPDAYSRDFVEQLKPFLRHVEHTNFLGGEPFLIDLYFDIWEYLLKENKRCKMHIQTNGLVLNNKVKSVLERGKFHIGISIDSLEEEKFESIRKFGNFKRWMSNLDYFRSYTRQHRSDLSIVFTPMVENRYEVPEFLRFANKWKAYLYMNTLSEPEEMAIDSLDTGELKDYVDFLKKESGFNNNTYIEKANLKVYTSYISQVEFIITSKSEKETRALVEKEEEIRKKQREEDSIREGMALLHDISFDDIKSLVKDRMVREYEQSDSFGKLDINLFLQEYETRIMEEFKVSPAVALDNLKRISLSEKEQFAAAIHSYIRESIASHGLIN